MFDDPAADIAFPTPGIAAEQRAAVEHDTDAAAAIFAVHRFHLRNHVLEEEKTTVVDARQAGSEASRFALRSELVSDLLLVRLPFHSEGRIGEHVVEFVIRKSIKGEAGTELDVLDRLSLDEHVAAADGERLLVPILAE